MAPGKQFPLSVVIEAIDKATAPLRKINRALSDTFKPVAILGQKLKMLGEEAGITKLAGRIGGVGKALGGVADAAQTVAMRFAYIGGIIGGALGFIIKRTADAGDAVSDNSQRVGLAAREYGRLSYAIKLSGGEQEDLNKGLIVLNKQIVAAATGSEQTVVWFKRAGVAVKDLHGKVRPTDVILGDLAEKFKNMPDGAAKTALAMGIFGKAGATIIPLLNNGRDGLKELGDEAERLGVVFTDKNVKAAALFNDSMDRLKSALDGLTFTIGNALIPVVQPMVVALTNWVVANREIIGTRFQEWAKQLPGIITQLTDALRQLWDVMKGVGDVLLSIHDLFGSWKPVIIGVAAIIAGPLISALVSLSAAFISLGVAIMTTPVGWVIAGLAAIVTAGWLLWRNWDKIWGAMKSAVQVAVDAVRGIFSGLFQWLSDKFGWVGTVVRGIANAASGVFGGGKAASPAGVAAPVAAGAPINTAAAASGLLQGSTNTNNAAVQVDFTGVPRGVNVMPMGGTAPLDLNVGFAMGS